MRASKFLIHTLRETPGDAVVSSHILMLRAGLIKKLGSGLYHMLPLGLRAFRKVERVIREEMNAAGALEFQLPILTPSDLWKQSGRWETMGPEMFRLNDRHKADNVLGPTHEESFSELMSGVLRSYKELPKTVYQIHTKFRDEIRPRFGVMRSREFCMKDAYSFDRDEDSLDHSYQTMRVAYRRVFARLGLETIPVEADTGTMGGSASEEFMVPSEIGEEILLVSENGTYAGNQEKTPVIYGKASKQGDSAARAISDTSAKKPAKQAAKKSSKKSAKKSGKDAQEPGDYSSDGRAGIQTKLEKMHTPGTTTIESVSEFLKVKPRDILKCVVYLANGQPVAVCLRADRQVNEVKLKSATGAVELEPAPTETIAKLGSVAGYIGPVGLDPSVPILYDTSIYGASAPADFKGEYVIGANEVDHHSKGWQPGPGLAVRDLALAVAGDPAPNGDGVLSERKGIEVGHIFKLGAKYTTAFDIQILDENGKTFTPTMGCYGIGVNRTLAAIIEQSHDDQGIAFPVPAAPFEVALVGIAKKPEELAKVEELYNVFLDAGIDVLWDDRDLRPGVKFNDAELIGYPVRVTAGKFYIQAGKVEITIRSSGQQQDVSGSPAEIADAVQAILADLNSDLRKRMKLDDLVLPE